MGGFLQRDVKGEEDDPSEGLEEQYEQMFAKIGRDFVYKEDFYRVILKLLNVLGPAAGLTSFAINIRDDSGARQKALEYKNVLDSGRDGSEIYKDLINLDE